MMWSVRGMISRFVCVCATFIAVELIDAQVAERYPNIVIIYADDMGYGDLGVQNPESKIQTPNLDQLAKDGMRFTDGHSSSRNMHTQSVCPFNGSIPLAEDAWNCSRMGDSVFADERLTLPEMLKRKGYQTACIGKWHLGFDWSAIRKPGAMPKKVGRRSVYSAGAFDWTKRLPDGPLDHGFDYYFGDDVPNYPPYTWIENDRILGAPTIAYVPEPTPTEGSPEGRPGPMVKGWKQDQVMPTLTNRVVEWIGEQAKRDQPFFLYWSWTSPHAPIVPVKSWQGKSNAGGFGDFVAQSDHHAGQVLKALDEHGFRDNTIVIFTADNGPERYAYDRIRNHQHDSRRPLRGLKRDILEGGHRVPFVVRWPGVVQAGAVCDGLMSQIDIMATLADVVGFELPDSAADDSHNQISLWKGGSGTRQSLVHNTRKGHYAIRKDNWVLIDAPSGHVSRVPEWFANMDGLPKNPHPGALFDLSSDIGQRKNLYSTESQRVGELRKLLDATRASGEVR